MLAVKEISIQLRCIYIEKALNGIVAIIATEKMEEMKKEDMQNEIPQKKHKKCKRCNRKLKNPKYQELGYGPSCYKKMLMKGITKPLFEVKK